MNYVKKNKISRRPAMILIRNSECVIRNYDVGIRRRIKKIPETIAGTPIGCPQRKQFMKFTRAHTWVHLADCK